MYNINEKEIDSCENLHTQHQLSYYMVDKISKKRTNTEKIVRKNLRKHTEN